MAVENIGNESLLIDLTLNSNDRIIIIAAIRNKNLRNKEVLKKVAANDQGYEHEEFESIDSWERVKIIDYPIRDAALNKLHKLNNEKV